MDTRTGREAPTVSVVLPYQKTEAAAAVERYNKTERTVLPWQELLLYDIMAVDEEGLWKHQKFGISVPRRNGKSELVLARCLHGLASGEKILYTAHRTSTSHSIWERLDRLCEKSGIAIESRFRAFGKEHLYAKDAGRIEFRTRTSTGGLGEGYDLLIIDEAQEYTPEQETALKYVVSDSLNPQTIMIGTPPTAISAGTVFQKYRTKVLAGGTFESGWAEWSVDSMTDPKDVDAWYETNPSLGTILTERTVRAEIGEDDTDFNIQRLGLWLKYNQKSAISGAEWDSLEVERLPKFTGPMFCGIKFGHDTDNVSLAIALKTVDDKIFAEVIDCREMRAGLDWILQFIERTNPRIVVSDGAGGSGLLADAMKRNRLRAPKLPKVAEVVKANALLEQKIADASLIHMNQPSVRQVVANCERRGIGTGGYGYRSQLIGADISILDSIILAVWACSEDKGEQKQRVSY